jgi:hypothetical protein
VIAGVVLAVAAAGVGWAASRAVSTGVITACVDAASPNGPLNYSPTGTCTSGQTTVQWNAQGPQGQPGLEGPPGLTGAQGPPGQSATATGPVLAWGPSSYKGGFSISAQIDAPGQYVVDGSVEAAITPSSSFRHTVVATCRLLTGPPNGTATGVALWQMAFIYNRHTRIFAPSSISGPVDINSGLGLARTDVPLVVYFSCKGFLGAVWTHPQITIEAATTPSFHRVVGAALPNRPVIGPGPIEKVLGTH